MYEHRRRPMLTRAQFARRMLAHFAFSATLVAVSLFAGMWGYHHFEGLSWLDGFLNAAMLLGGMGPVNELHTDAGKLFAGCYALSAGLVFLIVRSRKKAKAMVPPIPQVTNMPPPPIPS